MERSNAELLISAASERQFPKKDLPEIALAGRSNVGKSSFINTLLQRKKLAHTSSRPGKTRTLNFYEVDETVILVDVPGYGYAKVSKKEKAQWGQLIEHYLTTRKQLRGVVQIVDLRHPPTREDVQMYDYLKYFELPVIIVATKADKLSKNKLPKHVKQVREVLGVEKEDPVIMFSAETGLGKEEAWQEIVALFSE